MKKIIHDNDFDLKSLPVGDLQKVFYSKIVDDKGNAIYTERRRVNISEEIQSYKDGCMLSTLLSRLSMASADQIVSACNQNQTISADLSNMPKDLVSAFVMFKDLESRYPGICSKLSSGSSIEDLKSFFIPSEKIEKSEVTVDGSI